MEIVSKKTMQCPRDEAGEWDVCHEKNRVEATVVTSVKWAVVKNYVGDNVAIIDEKKTGCAEK